MSERMDISDHVWELFDAALDESLSDKQRSELAAVLKQSEHLRRVFLAHLQADRRNVGGRTANACEVVVATGVAASHRAVDCSGDCRCGGAVVCVGSDAREFGDGGVRL